MKTHNCTCCDKEIELYERYPNRICSNCYELPKYNLEGRRVEFSNDSELEPLFGSFAVHFLDEKDEIVETIMDKYKEYQFTINSKLFRAKEARFGGIVIESI